MGENYRREPVEYISESGAASRGKPIDTVGVCGLGYIGLPLVAALAKVGFKVIGCDTDGKKVKTLSSTYRADDMYEPGLNEALSVYRDSIAFTSDYSHMMQRSQAIVVCVGTPVHGNAPILDQIDSCLGSIAGTLKKGQLVVLRSTVPPGFTLNHARPLLEKKSGKKIGKDFFLAYCPERTIEGVSLHELLELPKIVAGVDERSYELASEVFGRLGRVVKTPSVTVAELCKIADNTYRTLNIAFANEFASLCEALGVDSYDVVYSVNTAYERTKIFRPGLGAAGPCLPKDSKIAAYLSRENHLDVFSSLLNSCEMSNDRVDRQLKEITKEFMTKNSLRTPKVGILGVAFKGWPETDDVRGSEGVELLEYIEKNYPKARIQIFDPYVKQVKGKKVFRSVRTTVEGANLILMMTDHPSIMNIDIKELVKSAGSPVLVVDCWHNLSRPGLPNRDDVQVYSVGKGWSN
ncbi:MAG: nucleotide sugar dehydrogenase [Thaumarchaeota archaeon]|nr:nucleotide sugar dehydrogenase [Nitrososphaerota archaeon]